jgi:hypothetical protein
MSLYGTLLLRANAAACPQLAKADFASSSQHVREGQRIAMLFFAPWAARPVNMAVSAFGGRRHAGAEQGVRDSTPSGRSAHTTARWKRGIISPLHE